MSNIGFWLFLTFFVAVAHLEEIGNAFKGDCMPVAQEIVNGDE